MPIVRDFEVNGIYHIYNRGYEKREIFLDDKDYIRFLISLYWFNNEQLVRIKDLTDEEKVFPVQSFNFSSGSTRGKGHLSEKGKESEEGVASLNIERRKPIVEILAFCLIPNHFHLILREIVPGGISLFMQKLGGGYTEYFNEKYDRKGVGGIFQGRYQSVRIKSQEQLIAIFNYVHTNPVGRVEPKWKDLIVEDKNNALNYLETYKWSSYNDYVGKVAFPNIIQPEFYLDLLGGVKGCREQVENWVKFKAENNILRVDK